MFWKEKVIKSNWIPGDLIVLLKEELDKSWGYRRIGSHLYRTEALTLNESLYGGWERKIAFLDNEEPQLTLSRDQGIPVFDGEVEIVSGKGMPIVTDHDEEERFGDLFIEYKVIIPGGAPKGKNSNSKRCNKR